MMKRKIRIEPDPRGNELQAASVSSSARGFTLVETMAVVAVGAILATIAIPAYRDWMTHSAVNNAVATIMSHLKQGRNMAMAENRNITVSFDLPAVQFTYDVYTYAPKQPQVVDLKQFSKYLALRKNNGTTVVFTSSGAVQGAMTMKVLERNYYRCITVNTIGRSYISDPAAATCVNL